jgi:histidinol phosphatase-like PHP family hydrolase
MYDLHTHTTLSDGKNTVEELVEQAKINKYTAIAITDHVDEYNYQKVLLYLLRQCSIMPKNNELLVLAGIELTGINPNKIARVAKAARKLGAQIIIVHGETTKESVIPGTNRAAVECEEIDVLAHPGLISNELGKIAKQTGVHLEITARKFHSLTNGHVAKVGLKEGACLIVNSDAHKKEDLLTVDKARKIAISSGLSKAEALKTLVTNPELIIKKTLKKEKMKINL